LVSIVFGVVISRAMPKGLLSNAPVTTPASQAARRPPKKFFRLAPGRKVKATLHWLSAPRALKAEVRLYDNLFTMPDPEDVPEGQDFTANLNPNSLETPSNCYVEPSLAGAAPLSRYQFERLGYFCVDPDSTVGKLAFNRTVTLKDTWAKIQQSKQVN
jgi:glutaminyl-tRNA synthetase